MSRPRLTDKVLRGIIAATSSHLAGDVASAFGYENNDTRADWDDMCSADKWARGMQAHREKAKSSEAR